MCDSRTEERVTMIAALAERWPEGKLGRTALVKCAYFLQTLKAVPLGYQFRLYSYGPYDSTVLDDLDVAEVRNEVEVKTVHYSGGYGYDIHRPKGAEKVNHQFVTKNKKELDWLVEKFGQHSAAELELDATIIYTYYECSEEQKESIVKRVREVKPRFLIDRIRERFDTLKKDDLLS